jgi:hypothetical protein
LRVRLAVNSFTRCKTFEELYAFTVDPGLFRIKMVPTPSQTVFSPLLLVKFSYFIEKSYQV